MHVIFGGAGHAHLYPFSRIRRLVQAGASVTVVAPDDFWYSGMGPGLVSGRYREEADRVDVARLVSRGGGKMVRARIARIDPRRGRIDLEDGRVLDFTHLSLNLGSEVPLEVVPGAEARGIPVKPVRYLADLHRRLVNLDPATDPYRVVVVGGGASGCEVAANLAALGPRLFRPLRVYLVHGGSRLLPGHPRRAHTVAEQVLEEAGVRLLLGRRAVSVSRDGLRLDGDPRELACDELVWAHGIRPPRLLEESGLGVDAHGAMVVDRCLECLQHERVFGAGDCVTLEGRRLPRVGVYAVRQAPVLYRNLTASLRGGRKRAFRPQRRFLLILNLGDGTGLLLRGGLVWRSRWAFGLKEWLDRRFVRRFQAAAR